MDTDITSILLLPTGLGRLIFSLLCSFLQVCYKAKPICLMYQVFGVTPLRQIETGRWSRIPRENRLCICGQIQTEEHVLLECVHTEKFRQECSVTGSCSTISDLMNRDENEMILISMLCYRVLDYFKNIQQ